MVTISICQNKKERKLFESLAEIIHLSDPHFVPPFPGTVAEFLTPHSSFKSHGEVHGFIAYLKGEPVGRIAAIINHTHNKLYQDKVGFFGFFDFIDNKEVSLALFEHAKAFLIQKGRDEMRGPYSPSVHEECGVLTGGFETAPMLMMPYNPPYYLSHYKALPLEPKRELYAYYMPSSHESSDRVKKIVARVKARSKIELRQVKMHDLKNEMKIIGDLVNCTLDRNWGHFPISEDDIAHLAKNLKPILDPHMLVIAEKDQKPIAFALAIPNINELLWKTKGSKTLFRILKFLFLLKTQRPKEVRLLALGIHPDFRKSGVDALLYDDILMRAKKNYLGGELSWIDETNALLMKSIERLGGTPYKTYQLYSHQWSMP